MSHDQSPNRHDRIAGTVRKVLARRTNDVHLIDDVCQNVLVICWKKERILQDLPFERLERFVVRVALNQFRSCVRKRKLLKWSEGFEKGSSDEDPAVATEKTEQTLRLLSLFNGLPRATGKSLGCTSSKAGPTNALRRTKASRSTPSRRSFAGRKRSLRSGKAGFRELKAACSGAKASRSCEFNKGAIMSAVKTLTITDLNASRCRQRRRFRLTLKLEAVSPKVFPPTYEGGKYATEDRIIGGQKLPCVLLDSVPSQANRMELALQDAWMGGEIELPVVSADFSAVENPGVPKVTSLQAPHRIVDAILRDSTLGDGKKPPKFRDSEIGKELDQLSAGYATPLLKYAPHCLVFGMWDSTGPRGGLGVKFARAVVSEIIGVNAVDGRKTSSRIDPLNIRVNSGILYAAKDGGWTLDEAKPRKDKGKAGQTRKGWQAVRSEPRQRHADRFPTAASPSTTPSKRRSCRCPRCVGCGSRPSPATSHRPKATTPPAPTLPRSACSGPRSRSRPGTTCGRGASCERKTR